MKSMSVIIVSGLLIWSTFVASTFASEIVCDDVGRFQLPEGRNGYVDCVPDGKGGFSIYREVDCEEYPYSNDLQNCDIRVRASEEYFDLVDLFDLERNDSYDGFCVDNTLPNLCYSCNRKIQCIDADAYIESCSEGETCAEDVNFGGGVCLPYDYALTLTSNCDCSRFGFAPDGFNTHCYMFCDPSTQPPTIDFYECPGKEAFVDGICQETIVLGCHQPEPFTPPCTEMGMFINPFECSYYYACIPEGGDQFEQRIFCCEDPTHFYSVYAEACENVCIILDGSVGPPFTCPGPGIFMDPYNCDVYYDCFGTGDPNEEHKCPDGTYYHNDLHACSSDVPVDCLEGSVDYSTCPRIDEVTAIAECTLPTTVVPYSIFNIFHY